MFIDYLKIDWSKIGEDSYLRRIPSLENLQRLEFSSPVTFFVGENGSGKSTLLEAIAIAYGFNPEGGTLNYSFSTYDDYSDLEKALILGKGAKAVSGFFLRAESFYTMSTKTKEYEQSGDGRPMFGEKTLHEQSHGESFMNFITTFGKKGLYIMDEPEAALSPQRQLALFSRISEMTKAGSQYIIVSHSPILLGLPGAEILCFDDEGLSSQKYEDTDSFRITEMFINHRDMMVGRLTGEK